MFWNKPKKEKDPRREFEETLVEHSSVLSKNKESRNKLNRILDELSKNEQPSH